MSDLIMLCCAAILGFAWIIVTLINNRCRHHWKPIGLVKHWKIVDLDGDKWDQYRQDVQCDKCGKISWIKRQGIN